MEIDIAYAALERITYKLSEYEVRTALVEYIRRIRQGKAPQGGLWTLESWDDDNDCLVIELTQDLRKAIEGPPGEKLEGEK